LRKPQSDRKGEKKSRTPETTYMPTHVRGATVIGFEKQELEGFRQSQDYRGNPAQVAEAGGRYLGESGHDDPGLIIEEKTGW